MGFSQILNKKYTAEILHYTTPFIHLDFVLSRGVPVGKWVESFSPEGIGKTTLNLQIALFILEMYKDTELLFIDAEMSTTTERIKSIAYSEVDVKDSAIIVNGIEKGTYVRPETYEQVDELFSQFTKYCIQNNVKGIILWDSLVALTSEKVLTKGSDRISFRATLIQQLIDSYHALFSKYGITQLVINQVRDRIDIGMFSSSKGEGYMVDTEYNVPGGRAHKFWTFQAIMLSKGQKWKDKTDEEKSIFKGRINKLTITKNKFGPDRNVCELVYIPEIGYSNVLSIIEDLRKVGYISGQGLYRMKVPFTEKSISLPDLLELLIVDEKVLNEFYNKIYMVLLDKYKAYDYEKYFDREKQRHAIVMDATRLLNFYQKKARLVDTSEVSE